MNDRGYACIGLDNPKNFLNVGAALRACGCYGAASMAISGGRIKRLARIPTDTQKQWRHAPLYRCADLKDMIPFIRCERSTFSVVKMRRWAAVCCRGAATSSTSPRPIA